MVSSALTNICHTIIACEIFASDVRLSNNEHANSANRNGNHDSTTMRISIGGIPEKSLSL